MRLGRIGYINCYPVYGAIDRGVVKVSAELVTGTPAELNDLLVAGELDVSVISAVEYARHSRDLVLLPDIAISSDGPVRSVMLFSRVPASGLDDAPVLLSASSRTSVGLLELLCRDVWKVRPRFAQVRAETADLETLAALPHQAVLVIGDPALLLGARQAYPHVYDLGMEWRRWTGLPFVFAVWAARRGGDTRAGAARVHAQLLKSRDWGLAHLDELARSASAATRVSESDCRSYFAGLDYALTDRHLAGLTQFFRNLVGHGLAPEGSLQFLPRGLIMVDRTSSEFRSFVDLYRHAPLLELGAAADDARWQLHPENVVTYIIDRNINYTNVCVADCKFCAFYRRPKHPEGYLLSYEEIGRKIEELKALGGVQILMQGGHNPYIPFEWYLDLLRYIKRNHPIHIHGFSPSEVDFFATRFGLSIEDVIRELVAAGLDSIPGGGGEILVQSIRDQVAKKKAGADRWLEVMAIAHRLGLKTSVTMMYGLGETLEDRMEHLFRVREVQRATGGFTAFICWPLQPEHTQLEHLGKTDAVTYLRTQAIARVVLDNVPNIQASWVTMGFKVGQVALRFGANDFGSLMMEENVVSAAGTTYRTTLGEMQRLIADAGYAPRKRRQDYSLMPEAA